MFECSNVPAFESLRVRKFQGLRVHKFTSYRWRCHPSSTFSFQPFAFSRSLSRFTFHFSRVRGFECSKVPVFESSRVHEFTSYKWRCHPSSAFSFQPFALSLSPSRFTSPRVRMFQRLRVYKSAPWPWPRPLTLTSTFDYCLQCSACCFHKHRRVPTRCRRAPGCAGAVPAQPGEPAAARTAAGPCTAAHRPPYPEKTILLPKRRWHLLLRHAV